MAKTARIVLFITIAATLAMAFAACQSSPSATATPTLTSVSPNEGCQGQSLTVTISGTNLNGATAVGFGGGVSAYSFTVDSSGTQITANITIDSAATLGPMDVSVTAPGGTGTLFGGFTVNPALTITTISLPAGDVAVTYSQTLSASGGSGTYAWSITSGSLPAGLSLDNSTGTITGTPSTAITSTITFRVADALGATASKSLPITVNPGVAARIIISPDNATITADESQAYHAEAYDAYGNDLGDVTSDTTFSMDPGAGGYCWANFCLPTYAGTWTVTGTYGSMTATASLNVNPGALDYIVIWPDDATITADDSQSYHAEAYDYYGNDLGDVSSHTTFTIDHGAHGNWSGNVYTPQYAGDWTVTGTYKSLTATANLSVTPGAPARIVISPDTATITVDDSQDYYAEAYDAHGNDSGDVTTDTAFTIDADAGGSWWDNSYAAEYAGTWTVTGTYLSLTDTAKLIIVN